MSRRRRTGKRGGPEKEASGKGASGKGPPPKRKIPGEVQPELKGDDGFRVPSIVMVPVGLAVGWFVAGWLGATLGGILGIFLWRSRA